jgi:Rod binding domain-containing protein
VSGPILGIGAPIATLTAAADKAGEKAAGKAAEKATAANATPKAPDAKSTKKHGDLDMAAREFEQIFVRSMLKDTPIAGKGDAYGDLAVDALAKSVTAGRGLGLGDLIKHSVELSEKALKDRG